MHTQIQFNYTNFFGEDKTNRENKKCKVNDFDQNVHRMIECLQKKT